MATPESACTSHNMNIRKGRLIVFEGIDGSGKTIQTEILRHYLERRGEEVVVSHEPTEGPWGKKIREAAKAGTRLPIKEEIAAFVRDRDEHIEAVIRPAMAQDRHP